MERIDRERLHTDLDYRFEYVSRFVGFTEADRDLISKSAPVVAELVPAIVDAVYEKIHNYDVTWASLAQDRERHAGWSSRKEEDVTMGSEVIVFRKTILAKYLKRLVTSKWDSALIAYLDWVGHVHTSTPTKRSNANVEYIHCVAMLGYLSGAVVEMLQTAGNWDQALRDATVNAYVKFFWIQNDLFARYYVKDRVLSEDEKVAVAREELAKEADVRRGMQHRTLVTAMLGTAAGIVIGSAVCRRIFHI
ncbi:hypothetical protein H4R21_004356 [Coemansia helicoidea]|uniref:Uncharacterized protein n=1 Tax=Coemansia helicoidea TaxID=1286919 RepID=A0ACC1KY99_9FUNG|nr:hypothetical protein H4R21_004356 [Coemansia helicoidea]